MREGEDVNTNINSATIKGWMIIGWKQAIGWGLQGV
jgi:hypothetical protein